MAYFVKEIYYTLQSEGTHAGRPAVFCRFSGCNLWNGREEDRHKAICRFCDTDFLGTNGILGGVFSDALSLAKTIDSCWPERHVSRKFVVCTGGEPLLQVDDNLISELKELGFTIAVETNGTIVPPDGIDWICVSPKAHAPLRITKGNEIKIIFPQDGIDPESFEYFEFDRFFVQPMDGQRKEENTRFAVEFCLNNPKWELSLQINKLIGMP